jgi:hypothetical protein
MVRGVWCCQWLTIGEARWAYKNYALEKVKFLKPERNIPFKNALWFYWPRKCSGFLPAALH